MDNTSIQKGSESLGIDISTVMLDDRPLGGWRKRLFIIIFEAETKLGKLFDVTLLWIILGSVALVILESDKVLNERFLTEFRFLEWMITIFFTIEYVTRIIITKRPLKYIFSFYGIIDLLSTLPSYLVFIFPQSQFVKIVRVLRLLRVFKVLKLVQFVKASRILGQSLIVSRFKIFIFFGVILSLVIIMGTAMYLVEGGSQEGFSSIAGSMYWTIVTMTTVGYGDIVPVTTLGKLVASFMMLLGYTIIAVPTGIVSAEIVKAANPEMNKNTVYIKCKKCFKDQPGFHNYCTQCGELVRDIKG